uniref:Killer cell immunoglobulin-like receptor 3DL3 n=1 Tax=Ailuropoda melanoleuca TaxID=9646 RepID=A0A7N5KFD5_AILME
MSPVVISLTCLGRPMQCRLPPAGGQDKPSLSAWPSPVVPQGQHVTLQCRSHHKFDTFRMYKDNGILVSNRYLSRRRHHGGSHANFSMGPATAAHGGTCRCFSSFNRSFHEWSAPSDPLDIMITGLHQKPSLWAQPGAVVRSGENVTFSCWMSSPTSAGSLRGRGVVVNPRLTSLWAPHTQPWAGPTDAMALSTALPVSGQARVTHCTFLSQVRKPGACSVSSDTGWI